MHTVLMHRYGQKRSTQQKDLLILRKTNKFLRVDIILTFMIANQNLLYIMDTIIFLDKNIKNLIKSIRKVGIAFKCIRKAKTHTRRKKNKTFFCSFLFCCCICCLCFLLLFFFICLFFFVVVGVFI